MQQDKTVFIIVESEEGQCKKAAANFRRSISRTIGISVKSTSLFAHWLILGIALLVLGSAGTFQFYQDYCRTEQREQERLLTQSRVVQEILGQDLLSLNQVLLNIRDQVSARSKAPGFDAYLRTLTDAMPGVRNVVIINADGKGLASSADQLVGGNFSHREYFQAVRQRPDADTLYISPPFHTVLGTYSVPVSRMIVDKEGRFAGVVTATLDPAYFGPLLESVRYAPDMLASIVHWNGNRFLLRPEPKNGVEINLFRPGTFFTKHRESGKESTVFSGFVFASGEERMIAQRTVKPASLKLEQPLVVAANRKMDDIFATWRRDAAVFGSLYVLICFASITGLFAYRRKHLDSIAKEAELDRMTAASERFMKTLTDHIPGMVAYWTDELRCRFSNAAYLEWFGKTPEQMRGMRMQDLMGQALFEKNESYIHAALRGEPQEFERTLTKADGSIGYTWAQYIPDKDGDKVKGFVVLVSDVTKLKQAELALASSEWKLKTIIEAEPECVTVLSADGTVQQMNRAGIDMVGANAEQEIIGCNLADMVLPQYQAAFSDLNLRVSRGESGSLNFELVGRTGIQRWLESHAVPMRDQEARITGSLCVIRDITDRKKAELELEKLAQTDFLTGLANRRHFMALAEQELARTLRYGGPLSVLMMDIDHFKKINDTYGHKSGDIVLQTFAQLFRSAVRSIDIVGRIGGEEFAAVLPETDSQRALEVAERLRDTISKAEVYLEHGLPIYFTMSIGVASQAGTCGNIDTLISWADAALYEAKNAGRNKVSSYKIVGT